MDRVGTRGRIVFLAIAAALPAMLFAGYLLVRHDTVEADVLSYGMAALIAVFMVVLVAWYGAERLILAPIRRMLETTARVSSGDLAARTGMKPGSEELSRLGAELDAMAERLEARDRDLQRVLAELQQQALTDALTGLYNRRFFRDALSRQCAETRRTANRFSLILLDIDHFKRVNDTWGHDAGDRVLGAVGRLLAAGIRESDIAARYGGEEFVVLMPDTTRDVAAERAEAMRLRVGELRVDHEGAHIALTASFGVVEWSRELDDPAALLKAVDAAMYEAKSRGRNRVVVSSDGQFHDYGDPGIPMPLGRTV